MTIEPLSTDAAAHPAAGRRERKKRRTRDTIQREAIRLFEAQGYEETTIDQIAEAADVAPSTVFHHFASKEDLIIWGEYDPLIASILKRQPAGMPLPQAMRIAVSESLGQLGAQEAEFILARARLGMSIPSVRGRFWQKVERTENWFRTAVAEWSGRDPEEFELKVAVGILMRALTCAAMQWMESGGAEDLPALIGRALDVVDAGGVMRVLERPGQG